MIKGTTPTFQLKVPNTVDLTQASKVYATFKQLTTTITKTGSDITVTAHQVDVSLTQQETLSLTDSDYIPLEIQLNWLYSGGARASTNVVQIMVDKNLINEVLS